MSKNTSSLKEIRNYKFIIYPNKEQERKLTNWLETCRIIYNSAVADRRNYYDRNNKGLTRTQQQVTLKTDKAKHPRVKGIHSQAAQEVLFRVERAFNNFFRRVKNSEKPGYPRYKGQGQYKSITFTQFGDGLGASFQNDKLKLSKIGLVKIDAHREIYGEVKTYTIKREQSGKWYAVLTAEECPVLFSPNWQSVGIDVGIKEFAVLSTGESIPAAIIEKNGKILITQRTREDKLSLKWEFPSGKIERGETPEHCLNVLNILEPDLAFFSIPYHNTFYTSFRCHTGRGRSGLFSAPSLSEQAGYKVIYRPLHRLLHLLH